MSLTLKNLLYGLFSILTLVTALDWQDQVNQLRIDYSASERLHQRQLTHTKLTSWDEELIAAEKSHLAWSSRLINVQTTGVFRAVSMERYADMCKNLDIVCQIGAEGEKVHSPTNYGSPKSSSQSVGLGEIQSLKQGASLESSGNNATTPSIAGLVSATTRVSVDINSPNLRALINEIENGQTIRKIDKLTVRSGRLELTVLTYGIFEDELKKLTTVAQSATKAATKPAAGKVL
jgi:hypothetical protein